MAMGEEAAAAVHRVVEGQRIAYKYRVSVTESSASIVSADSWEGLHNFYREVVEVQPRERYTSVCVPRAHFRVRAIMGPSLRNGLDELLAGHIFRPIRKRMIALLSEVYSGDDMVDARVVVEALPRVYNEEEEGLTERDDQSESEDEFEDDDDPMVFTGEDDDQPMVDDDQEYEPMVEYEYIWRPNPASRDAVDALESYTIKVDDDDDDDDKATTMQCSVCLDELHSGSELTKMPCSHAFHRQCILTWLQNQPMCPLCRFTLPSSSQQP